MKNTFLRRIILSYGLICLFYPFSPFKIILQGANGLNNSTGFSNWYASRVKKSYVENLPSLTEKPEWCLAYGMAGLDGGEGGIICGFKKDKSKFIYINPYYDCVNRDENYDCVNIENKLIRKYAAGDFIKTYNFEYFNQTFREFQEEYKNETLSYDDALALFYKINPREISYVRQAYRGFDPNSDWYWFKLHYGDSSAYREITDFFILILWPGTTILWPFIAFYFLYLLLKEFIKPLRNKFKD